MSEPESKAKHELKKLLLPKNYGPYWVLLHKKAFKAVTADKKLKYEQFVHELIEELECNHCREDAVRYLKEHPIRAFFSIKDENSGADIGCFKHSWLFHNHVNKKLGKKEVDWLTALGMYSETSGCEDCGVKDNFDDNRKYKGEKRDSDGKYHNEKNTQIKIVGRYRR